MTTTWQRLLDQCAGPAMRALLEERRQYVVYPELKDLYRAFDLCPFERVRVVVLGADPYFGAVECSLCEGAGNVRDSSGMSPCPRCDGYGEQPQANGLCFSVPRGVPIPPSLRNIYREIERSAPKCLRVTDSEEEYASCGVCHGTGNTWKWKRPDHGDLTAWAERGVLLLNSALSCRAGQPGSHAKMWAPVTQALLRALWLERSGLVWLVFGKAALKTLSRAVNPYVLASILQIATEGRARDGEHLILTAPHPADRRQGIVGSNVFVECNRWLEARGEQPIDWRLK